MGQELKIRHCVLKIKVNTNLIVLVPAKHISFYSLNITTTAVPVIQIPSSKSSPFKSKSKSKSLAFESKSSPSPQEIGLESDLSPSPGLEYYNSGINHPVSEITLKQVILCSTFV